jgi:hypothetical protein
VHNPPGPDFEHREHLEDPEGCDPHNHRKVSSLVGALIGSADTRGAGRQGSVGDDTVAGGDLMAAG